MKYLVLAAALVAVSPALADAPADWRPTASEKLIKLPGNYLEKAVENDFARSGLATALTKTDQDIDYKKDTLADLQAALDLADGEVRMELEHQFLTEKKRYLELMRRNQDLRKKRALTKVRLYERLLSKMSARKRAETPAQAELIAKQTAARERFRSSLGNVDAKLFRSSMAPESRYARDYAKNVAAIDSLVQAINAHPMNQAPEQDGRPMTREEYLRRLISENQAELTLVEQEGAVLGYMAKLVSLDALALSEGLDEIDVDAESTAANPGPDRIAAAVDFFVTR